MAKDLALSKVTVTLSQLFRKSFLTMYYFVNKLTTRVSILQTDENQARKWQGISTGCHFTNPCASWRGCRNAAAKATSL
jgi:hypothetical protein